MASYTMPLREIIEMYSQDDDTLSVSERIEIGRKNLFDFDYPIFNADYKKDFETHFIRNFYMREIGFETEGLFKFQLETWLNINMPYYNNLFKSELIDFDPLSNSKTDVSHTKVNDVKQSTTTSGQSTATQIDDNFNRNLVSDTPQNRLTITTNDGQGVIEYASGIEENNQNNSSSGSTNSSGNSTADMNENETLSQHREGKIGVQTYSKMLSEYRDTFLRIEKTMFNEMNELFMLVY